MKRILLVVVALCFLMMVSSAAWCGDNGNGTVTVNGLVWLKDAGCMGLMNWIYAKSKIQTLASGQCGLTDNSKAGAWRLPTLEELKAIYSSKSLFTGVQSYYWSSSTYSVSYPWVVYMKNGDVAKDSGSSINYVWPVRSP